MSDVQKRMKESFSAHRSFKEEWRKWESADSKLTSEPISVKDARSLFFAKNDLLFDLNIVPLERRFRENPKKSLDELFEFLLVDVIAFRSGYAKELFLRWLKKVPFSKEEIEKLQNLTLEICETRSFRREFRRWCQLAVKIADAAFVAELEKLTQVENMYAKVKSKWILGMIYQNRVDLRKTFPCAFVFVRG